MARTCEGPDCSVSLEGERPTKRYHAISCREAAKRDRARRGVVGTNTDDRPVEVARSGREQRRAEVTGEGLDTDSPATAAVRLWVAHLRAEGKLTTPADVLRAGIAVSLADALDRNITPASCAAQLSHYIRDLAGDDPNDELAGLLQALGQPMVKRPPAPTPTLWGGALEDRRETAS
jgi:hypothetical protein